MTDDPMAPEPRPLGRESVMDALIEATIEFIVEEGLNVSVRRIADRAGVNHGLVHAYFENKQGLLSAAADTINRRASLDADPSGFPPPDLASRRGGELAKAVARIQLDGGKDLFSSNPISTSWRGALARTRPDLSVDEIDTMVATASALGLGWALFSDHLSQLLGLDQVRRDALDAHVADLISELGGLPMPSAADTDSDLK
jgi:AcrR family transcriptional regulator